GPKTPPRRGGDQTARWPRAPPTSGARRRSRGRVRALLPVTVDRPLEGGLHLLAQPVELRGRERVEHVLDLFARRRSVAQQTCLEDHEEEGQAVDRDVPRLAGEELEAGLLLDESELAEAEGQLPLLPADDDLVGLDHDSVTSPEI